MEYNTNKIIEEIRLLMNCVEGQAREILNQREGISLNTSTEILECMYAGLQVAEMHLEEARILIGKMIDEREDVE